MTSRRFRRCFLGDVTKNLSQAIDCQTCYGDLWLNYLAGNVSLAPKKYITTVTTVNMVIL